MNVTNRNHLYMGWALQNPGYEVSMRYFKCNMFTISLWLAFQINDTYILWFRFSLLNAY